MLDVLKKLSENYDLSNANYSDIIDAFDELYPEACINSTIFNGRNPGIYDVFRTNNFLYHSSSVSSRIVGLYAKSSTTVDPTIPVIAHNLDEYKSDLKKESLKVFSDSKTNIDIVNVFFTTEAVVKDYIINGFDRVGGVGDNAHILKGAVGTDEEKCVLVSGRFTDVDKDLLEKTIKDLCGESAKKALELSRYAKIISDVCHSKTRLLRSLNSNIENARQRVSSALENYHANLESLAKQTEDLKDLSINFNKKIINHFETFENLASSIKNINNIYDVKIETNSVKFRSNPYVMENDGDCILIESMGWKIALDTDSFSRAVLMTTTDVLHPHIDYGNICWGTAGPRIAEAYSRNDIESVIRLILSFITQFNEESPFRPFCEYMDEIGTSDHDPGWIPLDKE